MGLVPGFPVAMVYISPKAVTTPPAEQPSPSPSPSDTPPTRDCCCLRPTPPPSPSDFLCCFGCEHPKGEALCCACTSSSKGRRRCVCYRASLAITPDSPCFLRCATCCFPGDDCPPEPALITLLAVLFLPVLIPVAIIACCCNRSTN